MYERPLDDYRYWAWVRNNRVDYHYWLTLDFLLEMMRTYDATLSEAAAAVQAYIAQMEVDDALTLSIGEYIQMVRLNLTESLKPKRGSRMTYFPYY